MWAGRNALIKRRRRAFLCGMILLAAAVLWRTCGSAGPQTVYLKQTESGTCTLTAAAMLLRETARRQEEPWETITAESLKKEAWCEAGLYWVFEYGGYTVRRSTLPEQGREALLRTLLSQYPQGIVAYNSRQPHGVWLTAYNGETDVFYAADPSRLAPEGQIPLAETVLSGEGQTEKLQGIDVYWYAE